MKHTLLMPILLIGLACLASSQQTNAKPEDNARQKDAAAIIYAEGGAFVMAGPKGWIADHAVGESLGVCCVYYPEGSTWDNAETVMYPNIATKRRGQQTLKEFMDYDLAEFRKNNPKMTFVDGEKISLKNNRTAILRYFSGINQSAYEVVAYIDEEKIVALVVLSSKTQKGLNDCMPLLRETLQTYAFMNVEFRNGDGAKPNPQAATNQVKE